MGHRASGPLSPVNASGKTTLLRHIVGLQLPTRGQARTLGVATRSLQHEQLARIGVVPDAPTCIRWMSVGRQLEYLSGFYQRWDSVRQSQLLDLLDLDERADISGLSTGSAQKLAIVAALCHHPDLILLEGPAGPSYRNMTLAIRHRQRPLRTVPRPGTGLIMAAAPE